MLQVRDFTINPTTETGSFFLVVHDSGICTDDVLQLTINGERSKLSEVGYRTPFIAILDADGIARRELKGKRYGKIAVELSN